MAPLQTIPTPEELCALIGPEKYAAWMRLCALTDSLYEMDPLWSSGGRKWLYEYKYRRGGKTLCALYAKEAAMGLMIVFGKDERERVQALRPLLSPQTLSAYDQADTYHDGKWVMFDEAMPLADLQQLLALKRKPSRA